MRLLPYVAFLLVFHMPTDEAYTQRLIRSIDFEAGSNFDGTDINISNHCEGCSQSGVFTLEEDPTNSSNTVSKITIKSCGECPDGFSKSDNRAEGFVLPYADRNEIQLGKTYVYEFSYFYPSDFDDWEHDKGGKWILVSQWMCWCSGGNCFGLSGCPKSNPDRYCENGGAGTHLTFRADDYSYSMKFHVDEGEGDDCISLKANSSANSENGGWDHHVMEIKWVDDNTGYIKWWLNSELVAEAYDFRTWWSGVAMPAWKLGMYMGGSTDGSWSGGDQQIDLYVDKLRLFEGISGCDLCPDCKDCSEPSYRIPAEANGIEGRAVNSTKTELNWTDNSDNEEGFIIHRKKENGDFELVYTTEPDITSFTDIGLLPVEEYSYRIAPYNFLGNAEFTEIVKLITHEDDGSAIISPDNFSVSHYLGNFNAEKLFDGNKYSYWYSNETDPYVNILFDGPKMISKLFIAFPDGEGRVYDFEILYLNESQLWESYGIFSSAGTSIELEEFDISDIKSYGLRIKILSEVGDVFVSEMEIRGFENTIISEEREELWVSIGIEGYKLRIHLKEHDEGIFLNIIDLMGRSLYSIKNTTGSSTTINTIVPGPGIYFIRAVSFNSIYVKKVIIPFH